MQRPVLRVVVNSPMAAVRVAETDEAMKAVVDLVRRIRHAETRTEGGRQYGRGSNKVARERAAMSQAARRRVRLVKRV
jgi:hypothetical protein